MSRWQGIKHCTGRFIVEIDADDWIDKEYLQKLYSKYLDTQAEFVCLRMLLFYSDNMGLARTIPDADYDMQRVISGKQAFMQTINGFKISLAGSLIRADKYKVYLESQSIDGITAWKDDVCRREFLLLCEKVAQVDVNYFYRQHKESTVHKTDYSQFNRLVVEEELWWIIKKNFPEDDVLKKIFSIQYIELYYRMDQQYYGSMHKFFAKNSLVRQSLKNALHLIKQEKFYCRDLKHKLIVKSKITLYLLLLSGRIYWKIKH